MLKDQIREYILNVTHEIFKEEKDYAQRNQLIAENITIVEKDPILRFSDAYIERCDKETEQMVANESSPFLNQPIEYLKKHKNEFIYIESNWFEMIRVDAVSVEADDVFGTYDVMLGLKLQKKFESAIKAYLNTGLHGEGAKFDLIFSQDDGLWNLNFALNYVDGFQEEMSIGEGYRLIYWFLFKLVEDVEESKRQG